MRVYIVMGGNGEYDGWTQWPVGAFTNRDRAVRFSERMNNLMLREHPRKPYADYWVDDDSVWLEEGPV